MKKEFIKFAVVAVVAAAASGSVSAGTNGFYAPFFRGMAESQVAGWERFTVAANGAGNLPDIAGSNATAKLTQTEPNAALTLGGNIYNQNHLSDFRIDFTASQTVGLVNFQIRTAGLELDYGSVALTYEVGGILQTLGGTRTELDRITLGPPGPGGGAYVSSAWQWDISSANVSTFGIRFKAADVSMSLDSATVDTLSKAQTALVPEPSTWALGAVGIVALLGMGWRRR